VAAQPVSAVDLAGTAARENEGRRNQRVGVLVPDQILRAPVEHAEHPVVARKIGEIPGDRRITLGERIGTIDQRDVVEFGAADPLRLHDPEQAGIVQLALRVRRQPPQLLGSGSTLAQARDQCPGAIDHGGIGADVRGRTGHWHLAGTCHFSVPCDLAALRGLEMRPVSETRLTGRSDLMIVYRLITNYSRRG